MFRNLRFHLDNHDIHSALDEAIRLSKEEQNKCKGSCEFLVLSARICALTRQWGLAQLLAHKALGLDGNNSWANALFAYTACCDSLLRGQNWEKIESLIPNFGSSKVGKRFKYDFLMQMTSYCPLPSRLNELVQHELQTLGEVVVGHEWELKERIKKMDCKLDWVLQVDAGEIGNESRYCNHADIPTAILVHRNGYPHIVGLRSEIRIGEEITINYGASYWKSSDPGSDPLFLDLQISKPFTDCIYFDGVLEDFNCSRSPGGFLIPPNEKAKRIPNPYLSVEQVPATHPAYPGFGVYAKKAFQKNEIICIYAGIVDMSPFSGRHASKYTVDITSGTTAIGPFGFQMDPIELTCLSKQNFMPFLTAFSDISFQTGLDPLEGLEDINEIGTGLTQTICRALMLPEYRWTVIEKLEQIPVPFRNPTKRDVQEWTRLVRKTFENILSKPPKPYLAPLIGPILFFLIHDDISS